MLDEAPGSEANELLEAGLRVLRRDGVAGVTHESVAAEAGVDPALVERSFQKRGNLLLELAIRCVGDLGDAVASAVAPTTSGEEALDALVRTVAGRGGAHLEDIRLSMYAFQILPEIKEALTPDTTRRMRNAGSRVYDDVEARLAADYGDEALPHGVHPRQLAFVAGQVASGYLGTMGVVATASETLMHADDAIVEMMSRVVCSPPRTMRQLDALARVSRELTQIRSEAELIERVPRFLTEALDFDRSTLLMDLDGELRPVAHAWPDETLIDEFNKMVRSGHAKPAPHWRRAMTTDSTIYLPDPMADPEWARLWTPEAEAVLKRLHWGAPIVMTPIRYQGRPIGVLVGHAHERWRPLDEEDVSRVEAYAAMVGIALENVRTIENLEAMVEERTRDLRDAQAALVQSEKMASMGELVAGVAHELNTPVGAVGSAQDSLRKAADKLDGLLGELLGEDRDRRVKGTLRVIDDSTRVIEEGTQRIDSIVTRLRSFARLDQATRQEVDLHECIEDTLSLLSHRLEGGIEVERSFGELPRMVCDPRKLNQLFLNLVANAIEAMEPSGRLGISTRLDDGAAEVVISDTGAGIDPDHLTKIFDPGFTTKGVGVGAGLGLAIAYRVVDEHGGSIDARSALGEGTQVTVRLPLE